MKKILYILLWLFIGAGVIALIGYINKKQKETICSNVFINIDTNDELFFVNQQDVWNIIYHTGDSLKGQRMGDIKTAFIRQEILQNPYIQQVEVYTTFMGEVNIEIKQRRPIARLITKRNQHIYIDQEGFIMPTHPNFAPRVVVVNGLFKFDTIFQRILLEKDTAKQRQFISKTNINKIYQLASCIDTSVFWKAQISEITVLPKQEFEFIPQFGNHVIVFGNIDNMVEKFDKLFLFYHKELNNFGFNKYKRINLKYKNQIVCTKK